LQVNEHRLKKKVIIILDRLNLKGIAKSELMRYFGEIDD